MAETAVLSFEDRVHQIPPTVWDAMQRACLAYLRGQGPSEAAYQALDPLALFSRVEAGRVIEPVMMAARKTLQQQGAAPQRPLGPHRVDHHRCGLGIDEQIEIVAAAAVADGAAETYRIGGVDVRFHTGGDQPNGLTMEALLAVVFDRLLGFQRGALACHENGVALHHVKHTLDALHARTRRRHAQGVEGRPEEPVGRVRVEDYMLRVGGLAFRFDQLVTEWAAVERALRDTLPLQEREVRALQGLPASCRVADLVRAFLDQHIVAGRLD